MPLVCEPTNLAVAFLRASRGKQMRQEIIDFRDDLWYNLDTIGRTLLDGTYQFGNYHFFTIYDPKKRLICAAPFRDRVAMHALMRVCHPVFEAFQVPHSFASRIGRGTYAALARTQKLCAKYEWYAKLDVRHYFDTIHHNTLREQLSRLFKDHILLAHFDSLLHSYEVTTGRGLPIGNLTSQYFANHYLSVADHYAKEHLRVAAMVRYMDDVLLFSHSHKELMANVKAYTVYVRDNLQLEWHAPIVNVCRFGLPFCGYVVRGNGLRLNQRSRHRYRKKMKALRTDFGEGKLSLCEYSRRVQALRAFVNKAVAKNFIEDESNVRIRAAQKEGMYP